MSNGKSVWHQPNIYYYITICPDCIQIRPEKPIKLCQTIQTIKPVHRYIGDLYQIPKDYCDVAALNDSGPKYKYIFMVVDHFSKYLWANLLENKQASSIIEELDVIFHQFGFPRIFHSDNGKEFKNKDVINYCEEKGIDCIRGRPYHPQSQGAIERLNYFVGKSLYLSFQDYQQRQNNNKKFDLPRILKLFVNNHNNKVHSVTKYKPNRLMQIEDENIIQQVNSRIKIYYENARNRIQEKELKVGMKVYIVRDVSQTLNENTLVLSKALEQKKKTN